MEWTLARNKGDIGFVRGKLQEAVSISAVVALRAFGRGLKWSVNFTPRVHYNFVSCAGVSTSYPTIEDRGPRTASSLFLQLSYCPKDEAKCVWSQCKYISPCNDCIKEETLPNERHHQNLCVFFCKKCKVKQSHTSSGWSTQQYIYWIPCFRVLPSTPYPCHDHIAPSPLMAMRPRRGYSAFVAVCWGDLLLQLLFVLLTTTKKKKKNYFSAEIIIWTPWRSDVEQFLKATAKKKKCFDVFTEMKPVRICNRFQFIRLRWMDGNLLHIQQIVTHTETVQGTSLDVATWARVLLRFVVISPNNGKLLQAQVQVEWLQKWNFPTGRQKQRCLEHDSMLLGPRIIIGQCFMAQMHSAECLLRAYVLHLLENEIHVNFSKSKTFDVLACVLPVEGNYTHHVCVIMPSLKERRRWHLA